MRGLRGDHQSVIRNFLFLAGWHGITKLCRLRQRSIRKQIELSPTRTNATQLLIFIISKWESKKRLGNLLSRRN